VSEHIKRVLAQKRCKIGPKLLFRTNRKSHTRFRLAPNLSTLDDLERPKRPSLKIEVLREVAAPTRKKLNEDRHKLSAGKCRRMILVSRNIRYIRDIREGSFGRGVKRLGCRRAAYMPVSMYCRKRV